MSAQDKEIIGEASVASRKGEDTLPKLRTLMTGIAFGESPRWHEDRLWFSDWIAQEVIAVDLEGKSEVITRVQSLPFCLDWLPDERLLITSRRSILRMEPNGSLVTHADLGGLTEPAAPDLRSRY